MSMKVAKPAVAMSASAADPIEAARERLFPQVRNRALADAAAALANDRADVAAPVLIRFLERRPDDPDALNLMADVARRARRFADAEQMMARCVTAAPTHAGYRFNYAVLLRRLERFDDALAQLETVRLQEPGNPLFREQMAALLRQMGRHDEALELRRGLTQDYPQAPALWMQFAHALRSMGYTDQSVAAYRKAIELAPASVAAYTHLSDLKTFRFTAAEIAAMEQLLCEPGLTASGRAELHFALGKALDDERHHAKAFDNYARANALQRAGSAYDVGSLAMHRGNCEKLFTTDFVRTRSKWGTRSGAPIFIVGMPRSGSTLVEQILSGHSAIEGLGELAELDTVVAERLARDSGRPAHEFWIGGWFEFRKGLLDTIAPALQQFDAEDFRALGEHYIAAVHRLRHGTKPHFSDKGLRNFAHAGLIALMFPNAKIVDVRRHPLDCGWSIFRSHFPGGQPFSNRLADIGSVYANYVRLMDHFDRIFPGRIHRVIYEGLVADPENVVRRLFEYLELPFEAQSLRFHESTRAVGTISTAQVRTPLYKNGIGQWKPYEAWLGPLKTSLGAVLDRYPLAPDGV
jgi:tetratricopeptide (TPR) repeat protein